MTQNERILNHLKRYGKITQLEATNRYGIMRLASRIYDLKKLGYEFEKKTVTSKNRYGDPVAYEQYRLAEEKHGVQ